MRKFILLIILSGTYLGSFAQPSGNGNFDLGPYGASPLENMRPIFNAGVGGSLKYGYRLGSLHFLKKASAIKYLYVTLESGYETFDVKNPLQNAYVPSTYSYVPVKAGIKYYPIGGLYAEGQYGVCIFTQHGGGHTTDYSPGIGYSFKRGFEIGIRLEHWTQKPENHITGDYGQSGPFATTSDFKQLELRLAERF